ncbi:MAG TPA: Ig-like domain-containing protein, partial [Acidobacteriota bacterium]|nr:Ig-like domain-containing protein [Acidobacteriota bacterium]
LHLVLISGLARYRWVYHAAKEEDIRNAQWFNDNKLCADGEIGNTQDALDGYIWGTLSRYARKLRANVEAKGKATLAFLKQRMTEEPETLIALSGWGESELSDDRINHALSVQDWACDYSPFAVLEFRDWLQHAGMYDDVAGAYKGQGYAGGGAKYQGAGGLAQFNADFGQGFTSWDLKYYNWSLADDYDAEPEDAVNNDPHLIPFSSYVHGAMMPTEGPDHTAGGFDPPRVMAPGNAYWDLWNTFREAMVHNFVKDMAGWASEAGIPATQWYSHQIPADYLFGTNPAMMPNLNPRYFTSASPLALADVAPYGSAGVTMYDIAFPGYFARTTEFGVPAAAAVSSNWAILEYDAEAYPEGLSVPQSTPDSILQQFLRTYSYRPHLINFFRWKDASFMHQIKGMNKEIALRDFIAAVRDLGRNTDTTFMYAPPKTTGLSGSYVPETAAIRLEVTGKIWSDLDWTWTDWGGFNRFDVYRGTAPNVPTDLAHKIGTTTGYVFEDRTATILIPYYYKVRAVNKNNVAGPASDEIMLYPAAGPLPVLSLDKTALYFGGALRGLPTPAQRVIVRNQGPPETTLNWRTTSNKKWLLVSPPSGSGNAALSVSVNLTGLSIGTYRGKVTVADAGALGSPRTISVALKVYRARGDAKPFGSFDSPVNGSTVMGTIPVSGWALDDVGVARVEIKRDPIAGDDAGSIGADGLVHVGEASFIRGARPDVEAAWKTSPNKDRAGWGTTLLTYDLPGRGNGPLRLHAIATDMGGKKKELGVKSVVADNANNTNPFGMIDTPAHGEVASGAAFASSAWALTPLSKEIPRDGSTIRILIDSLPAGNPVYN